MSEKRFDLQQIEKFFLENLMLKEELLRRDFTELKKQREAAMLQICQSRGVNPSEQKYRIDNDALFVEDASAANEATANEPQTPSEQ